LGSAERGASTPAAGQVTLLPRCGSAGLSSVDFVNAA